MLHTGRRIRQHRHCAGACPLTSLRTCLPRPPASRTQRVLHCIYLPRLSFPASYCSVGQPPFPSGMASQWKEARRFPEKKSIFQDVTHRPQSDNDRMCDRRGAPRHCRHGEKKEKKKHHPSIPSSCSLASLYQETGALPERTHSRPPGSLNLDPPPALSAR